MSIILYMHIFTLNSDSCPPSHGVGGGNPQQDEVNSYVSHIL